MKHLLAQTEQKIGEPFEGIGPLGEGAPGDAPSLFNKFISSAIGLMTVIATIWFTFLFITGAIGIISSGGDKAQLETAKKKLTSGVIGLALVIAGLFILQLIGSLLGLEDALNPAKFIEGLWN